MDSTTCLSHLNQKADLGCGVLLFLSLMEICKVLVYFFLFGTGLRYFRRHYNGFLCDLRGKSDDLRKILSSKSDFDVEFNEKDALCGSKLLKVSKTCDGHESSVETMKKIKNSIVVVSSDDVENFLDEKEGEHELYDEDEEFDVLKLRKMIKYERNKARKAWLEVEKEQLAASSAADETMAMILRLQNEKSLVEMEANQYRRLAEEKQLHAQQVIQSLQVLLLMHEGSHKTMESDDGEESCWSCSNGMFESNASNRLFRSLDVDLSPW